MLSWSPSLKKEIGKSLGTTVAYLFFLSLERFLHEYYLTDWSIMLRNCSLKLSVVLGQDVEQLT